MLVIRKKNFFRQLEIFGSQRKASVVRPDRDMPDLAFKAPTCVNRDQVFFLHGKVGPFITLSSRCGTKSAFDS